METHQIIEKVLITVANSYEVSWKDLLVKRKWSTYAARPTAMNIMAIYLGVEHACEIFGVNYSYTKRDRKRMKSMVMTDTMRNRHILKTISDWYNHHTAIKQADEALNY